MLNDAKRYVCPFLCGGTFSHDKAVRRHVYKTCKMFTEGSSFNCEGQRMINLALWMLDDDMFGAERRDELTNNNYCPYY